MLSVKGDGFAPGCKVIKQHFSIRHHVGFRFFFFFNIKFKLLKSLILRIGRGEIC